MKISSNQVSSAFHPLLSFFPILQQNRFSIHNKVNNSSLKKNSTKKVVSTLKTFWGLICKTAYLGFAFQEIPMKQIESIFGVSYLCCSGRSDLVRIGVQRPPVPTSVEDQLLLLLAGLPLDLPLKKTPKRTHYAHFFLDCSAIPPSTRSPLLGLLPNQTCLGTEKW